MEAVNIRIGPLTFDHADYDADGDVLYLHVGQPRRGPPPRSLDPSDTGDIGSSRDHRWLVGEPVRVYPAILVL